MTFTIAFAVVGGLLGYVVGGTAVESVHPWAFACAFAIIGAGAGHLLARFIRS